MQVMIDEVYYPIKVQRKNNKNTYIRVNKDYEIVVTTSYFITDRYIKKLVLQNIDAVKKMLNRKEKENEKENHFFYLGKEYDIIIVPTLDDVDIEDGIIYTKSKSSLEKWYQKNQLLLYKKRLDFWYNLFEEEIPYPKLKIRKMKTRWGVCNKRDNSVTLNSLLMKEEIECLDYVIIHELSHFVHFNHSKDFWNVVSKYCPNYKNIRKKLKE